MLLRKIFILFWKLKVANVSFKFTVLLSNRAESVLNNLIELVQTH